MHIRDLEMGLDYPVITHRFAPEYFHAEAHFPPSGQFSLTLKLSLSNNLVPAILRVTKDKGAGGLQCIMSKPEVPFLIFDGTRC
ncbi:hypothetical protein ES703_62698 [subsurface metagenome]